MAAGPSTKLPTSKPVQIEQINELVSSLDPKGSHNYSWLGLADKYAKLGQDNQLPPLKLSTRTWTDLEAAEAFDSALSDQENNNGPMGFTSFGEMVELAASDHLLSIAARGTLVEQGRFYDMSYEPEPGMTAQEQFAHDLLHPEDFVD